MNHSRTDGPAADPALRRKLGQRAAAVWTNLKALAPYALIELVLPGGTVLAILCWLYRRRRIASRAAATTGLAALLTSH